MQFCPRSAGGVTPPRKPPSKKSVQVRVLLVTERYAMGAVRSRENQEVENSKNQNLSLRMGRRSSEPEDARGGNGLSWEQ